MKKIILFLMLVLCWSLFSISNSEFVLNVVQEYPVHEFDGQVAIQFDSEYELLLKNNNDRDCSARIWIDGSLVSEFGDFIIGSDSELNLERFVSESMSEGKRFKFVSLDHPEVDDPSRAENGLVKVEFRLEKKCEYYIAPPEFNYEEGDYFFEWDKYYELNMDCSGASNITYSTAVNVSATNYTVDVCSNTSAGATIGGSQSNQAFIYRNIDVEDQCVVLTLRIAGIK